jgi:hypothetical protein
MDCGDWLALVGENWTTSDNIRDYVRELRCALGTAGPLLHMITSMERAAYAALPDMLTVYRGCSARHLTGASWSLEEDVARNFPKLNRYRVPDPVLVTVTVRKENVLAVKLDREEHEIITSQFDPASEFVPNIRAVRRPCCTGL